MKNEFDYDVTILGAGAAGTSAAICAARTGARTLLVEKNGMPGGTATVGRVNFPGLFHAWGRQVIGGPCFEVLEKCRDAGGADFPAFAYCPPHHSLNQIPVDIFTYVSVLEETLLSSGVTLLYHTMPASVRETDGGVTLTLTVKGGSRTVRTRTLIDATGDADGLRLMGCETVRSETVQPCTLINDISGYDPHCLDDRDAFEKWCEKAYENGTLSLADTQGQPLWGQVRGGRLSMHIDADGDSLCVETSEGRTNLEIRARAVLRRLVTALRGYPGLQKLTVTRMAAECGVRESVRCVGRTVMSVDKYVSGYVYPDAVCYAFYPVDRHIPEGIVQVYHAEGVVPTVPCGALMPVGTRHTAVAGRCVSADTDTQSAVRVQAACMAMGQAAGVLCALAAARGCDVPDVPVCAVRERLTGLGAVVPPLPDAE